MKYLVVLLLLLTSVGVSAQTLTLERALQMAEEHSHALKASRANLESAEQTVRAARAERFPTLSLAARAGYIDETGSLELALPGLPSISREIGSNDSYQTDLRLSVPLHTGGRLSSAIKQAESGREYRQALEQAEQDNLFLATRLEFLGLCRTKKLHEAATASEKRISVLRDGVVARLDAGVADSVDLLEIRLASTRAASRSQEAGTAARSAEIRLLSRIGPWDSKLLEPVISLQDPDRLLEFLTVSDSLPRLRAASALVEQRDAALAARRAALYPTLGVYAGYSYGKPNTNPFADEFNDSYTVGAQLNWSFNLGGGQSAQRKSARFALAAARQQHDQYSETFQLEAKLAGEECLRSIDRFTTSTEEYAIARDNFRLAQAQHDNGSLPSNRLLEIENSLTEAEAQLAAARVNFYIAQSVYFYAAGDERLRKGL